MEFTAKGHLLLIGFCIRILQIVKEVFEQINTLLCFIAYFKDRTDNLALHLPIYQNNILFIKDNISNFRAKLPYLGSQLIYDVF